LKNQAYEILLISKDGSGQVTSSVWTGKVSGKQRYWKETCMRAEREWVNAVEKGSREILKVRNWRSEFLGI
jgi:hypothetical protein